MPLKYEKSPGMPLTINWHEGMLLSQHHFQQNDMRIFQTLSSLIRFISPFIHGVLHLEYDRVALSKGFFQVSYLEAIFQDSMVVVFDPKNESELKPIEIDLTGHKEDEIKIYICLKKSTVNSSPVTSQNPRYYPISGKEVRDNNLEENVVAIPRLFPNVFLTLDSKFPEGCIGFPICKVKYQDQVYVADDWAPPCCTLFEDSKLWKNIQELIFEMRDKISVLIEKYKSISVGVAAYDTQRILNQLKMAVAPLEALLYSKGAHPYDVYLELSRVLSLVSVLAPTEMVPMIRPYDHDDIDQSVTPIIDLIRKFLDVIEREYTIISFNKKEYFFYKYLTSQNFECFDDKLYIGIKGDKMAAISDVEDWMKGAIIVSDFALDSVRTKRIQGAARRIMSQEMTMRILPSLGVIAFEIDLDPRFIREEQNLHIFNPARNHRFQPSEVLLYVVRGGHAK